MIDEDQEAAARLDAWDELEAAAVARAVEALDRPDISRDDLVSALRTLGDEIRKIPPRVRAADAAHRIADEIVEALVDAGVQFADESTAPAQIAGTLFLGWMSSQRVRPDDPVHGFGILDGLADAISWARFNSGESDPRTRELAEHLTAVGDL